MWKLQKKILRSWSEFFYYLCDIRIIRDTVAKTTRTSNKS